MCYHASTPEHTKLKTILTDYEVQQFPHFYHTSGFSHQRMPITIQGQNRLVQGGYWGLIPESIENAQDAKAEADKRLNARDNNVFKIYPGLIKSRRCLIWVDGFYDWHWDDAKGRSKTPYYIYMPEHKPFTFGGIFSDWVHPDNNFIARTFSIITTNPNERMEYIHNNTKRMPLVILEDERDKWLGDLDKDGIKEMMRILPDGILQDHTVSKLVSNTRLGVETNIPEVQARYDYKTDTLF